MRSSLARRLVLLPALLALALGNAACDSGDNSTPTTPSVPNPTTTETFTGSIGINGAATFTFPTSASGSVTATLRTITPTTTQVSLSLGTWNGASCTVVLTNDRTSAGGSIVGSVSGIGTLCVRVSDIGQNVASTGFEIVVVHP